MKFNVSFYQKVHIDTIEDIEADNKEDAIKQAERQLYKQDYEDYTMAEASEIENENEKVCQLCENGSINNGGNLVKCDHCGGSEICKIPNCEECE